jgi:PAS domain S-box-containing protein
MVVRSDVIRLSASARQLGLAAEARGAISSMASVFETRRGAIILVDGSGQICLANAAAESMFGYGQGELVGRLVEVLIPDRYRGRHPGQRARFLASGKARPLGSGLELVGMRQDGLEFPVDISINPLEIAEGTFMLATILNRPPSGPVVPGHVRA